MIVQVVKQLTIAKDSLTRYTATPLILNFHSRGGNLSWHNRNKRKRTEVISDNLLVLLVLCQAHVCTKYAVSQPCYYIVNGDCLNRSAARLLGYRPMKIRSGNGAFVVVRAGESPVHGEGGQLIILVQLKENV